MIPDSSIVRAAQQCRAQAVRLEELGTDRATYSPPRKVSVAAAVKNAVLAASMARNLDELTRIRELLRETDEVLRYVDGRRREHHDNAQIRERSRSRALEIARELWHLADELELRAGETQAAGRNFQGHSPAAAGGPRAQQAGAVGAVAFGRSEAVSEHDTTPPVEPAIEKVREAIQRLLTARGVTNPAVLAACVRAWQAAPELGTTPAEGTLDDPGRKAIARATAPGTEQHAIFVTRQSKPTLMVALSVEFRAEIQRTLEQVPG